jgi:uncharacterized protein
MNRFLLTTCCAAMALLAGCKQVSTDAKKTVASTPPGVSKPALWVVKDSDTTIYLFGTVHVLKPDVKWFDGEVKTAFDSSQEAVFELIDEEDPKNMGTVMKMAIDPDGPPLTQKLEPAKREAYIKAMQSIGVPHAGMEQFEPWFVTVTASMMPMIKEGYDPKMGVDKVLQDAAKKSNKKLVGLETTLQQIGFFDTMDEKDQIAMLNEAVKQMADGPKIINDMVGSWKSGDIVQLAKLMNAGMGSQPAIEKILLTDRNAKWAQWIDDRMDKPGTVFIAVGAGHLAGKNSVQDFLKARKLNAERIKR